MNDRADTENNELKKIDGTHLKFFIIQKIFDLLGRLLSVTLYLGLAYFSYLSIIELAGKTTITNMVVGYFTAKESDYGIPWLLALFCLLWGYLERRERRRKTEELHKYNKKLEEIINPNRTSSGILPNGETNPKDEKL